MAETPDFAALDITFSAEIIADNNSGWLCVQMPGSGKAFGTGKALKVEGTVNGHEYAAAMLPVGGGTHMMPIRAALRGNPRQRARRRGRGAPVRAHCLSRVLHPVKDP